MYTLNTNWFYQTLYAMFVLDTCYLSLKYFEFAADEKYIIMTICITQSYLSPSITFCTYGINRISVSNITLYFKNHLINDLFHILNSILERVIAIKQRVWKLLLFISILKLIMIPNVVYLLHTDRPIMITLLRAIWF